MINQIKEDVRVIDEALKRVRNLSFELRPSLLDDLGLAAAIRWYVDRYTKRAGIENVVQIDSEIATERLPREVETACFRILQEALTNVARHAKASSVCVRLSRVDTKLLLSVKDDGVGMEMARDKNPDGHFSALGLRGMEERALAVAGQLNVISASSIGTEVQAHFPLASKRESKLKNPIDPKKEAVKRISRSKA
jgi:signal transduction histidine kinase